MRDEELKRFRDYANHYKGSDVDLLVEHIDAQDKQIAALYATIAELEKDKEDLMKSGEWP
jgi:hypothetical protein